MANLPTDNYEKNAKPLVKVNSEDPFSKKSYQQGDMNKSPFKSAPSLPALDILKNKVSDADSTRLQKASKLPGRVSSGGSVELS